MRPPVVLVANAPGTWLSQALASLLKPRGYRLHFTMSGRETLERAPALRPDIILLDTDLPDLDAIAVCHTLRRNRAAWSMPIIMVTSTPGTRAQTVAALEAGAWDYVSVLMDPTALTWKIDAMVRLTHEVEHALEQGAVDATSGLYTRRGLERRARELTAEAFRGSAPIACVAIGIDTEGPGTLAAAVAYAGQVLQATGRASDAIGNFADGALAVLAPATSPEHALTMARRLSRAIETAGPRPAGVPPLWVSAGYDAAADARATPIEPMSFLEHAATALRAAREERDEQGGGERIRAYRA